MMCAFTYTHVITVPGSCNLRKKQEMQSILVSYPLELIHSDFLTFRGEADDNRSVNMLVVMDHFTQVCASICNTKTNSTSGCSEADGKIS